MQEPDRHIPERFRSRAYLDVVDESSSDRLCLIRNAAMHNMYASAEKHYPHEACGLLLGKLTDAGWYVDEAREVSNLNMERSSDRYLLDPAAYQAVDRELRGTGREIIGIYHSHPDCPAKPSPTDLADAWDSFAYVIISTCNGRTADMQCWTLNAGGDKFQAVSMQDLKTETD